MKAQIITLIPTFLMFMPLITLAFPEPGPVSSMSNIPEIRFIKLEDGANIQMKKKIVLEADLKHVKKGKKIRVLVNREPVRFRFDKKKGHLWSVVKLLPGQNEFVIAAVNSNGYAVEKIKINAIPSEKGEGRTDDIPSTRPGKGDMEPAVASPEKTKNNKASLRTSIIDYADRFKGTPYKYGGSTPAGFDCSGFVSYVMKEFDVNLPRVSRDQAKVGKKVKLKHVKTGDLVFFSHNKKTINHVALVVKRVGSKIYVIHSTSSKGVRVDEIMGSSYWKSRVMTARSVL